MMSLVDCISDIPKKAKPLYLTAVAQASLRLEYFERKGSH